MSDSTTTSTGTQSGGSGGAFVANWLFRLIPAVIVGRAAWMKFGSHPDVSAMFNSLGMEPEGRILVGLLEALCVVMLLSPRISAWGAMLCLAVMTGAVIAHVTVIGFGGALAPLFGMALLSGGCSVALIYRLRGQVPFVDSMFAK